MFKSVFARSAVQARSFSSSPAVRDVAKLTLVGRLGADLSAQTSANGRQYVRYPIAVRSGREETSWFQVVSFDSNVDYLVENFKKGSLVYIEASASMQPYETSDGRKVASLQLVQRSIQKLSNPQAAPAAQVAAE
ncbi:uncharacterized protein V1510DRAFT_413636 [Dipodascopsis tothii]|uniref:uncharacterized protein n=1 Tax=Dipodascopsis tothii TaxID=44089 RepID=UPI0034CF2348